MSAVKIFDFANSTYARLAQESELVMLDWLQATVELMRRKVQQLVVKMTASVCGLFRRERIYPFRVNNNRSIMRRTKTTCHGKGQQADKNDTNKTPANSFSQVFDYVMLWLFSYEIVKLYQKLTFLSKCYIIMISLWKRSWWNEERKMADA